jgi:hypothetical protein
MYNFNQTPHCAAAIVCKQCILRGTPKLPRGAKSSIELGGRIEKNEQNFGSWRKPCANSGNDAYRCAGRAN